MTDAIVVTAGEKHCDECGKLFTCGGAACWCADTVVSEDVRERLRTRYRDCLCPACLMKHAAADAAALQPPH